MNRIAEDSIIDVAFICNNKEVIGEIAGALEFDYEEGTNKLCGTVENLPLDTLKAISVKFPNEVIDCHIYNRFEPNRFDGWNYILVEAIMRAGEYSVIDTLPFYSFSCNLHHDQELQDRAYKKAANFFKKIDKVETGNNGLLSVAWIDETITYHFEIETPNPLFKYRVEATKDCDVIDLKFFEGRAKFTWVEADDLPF